MLRIWIQHINNSLVPPWCLAVQWYSWKCSGIPSKYYGTFQITIVLASVTLPSLHSSTATVLRSKGCIRELHSQDDVEKIWFQISLILLFSPSILPIFLSGIHPFSLCLSLRSVCSVVPLYLSAFVRANVLKWREIKAGKPCVSHTNSSPCGPIGSQHAYWWRHTVPSLRCASTSPSHLWQEPARSTPSHAWNIHAEHRDNLSYWGTHTYAQT